MIDERGDVESKHSDFRSEIAWPSILAKDACVGNGLYLNNHRRGAGRDIFRSGYGQSSACIVYAGRSAGANVNIGGGRGERG